MPQIFHGGGYIKTSFTEGLKMTSQLGSGPKQRGQLFNQLKTGLKWLAKIETSTHLLKGKSYSSASVWDNNFLAYKMRKCILKTLTEKNIKYLNRIFQLADSHSP